MRPPFTLQVRVHLSDAAMRRIERRSRARGSDWARLRTTLADLASRRDP